VRLAFPDASLVLTGRETTPLLLSAADFVNVIGKDGSTAVGGYSIYPQRNTVMEQFSLQRDMGLNAFRVALQSTGFVVG
jgi:hypothetical protein